METFTYSHVIDVCGGTAGATLQLDKYYTIAEDGQVYAGPCDTRAEATAAVTQQNPDIVVCQYEADFAEGGECWACSGAEYKRFYEQYMQ